MAITSNDIKVFQSQDNTDNDSGGGSRTSTEIVDGNVNNLFPDISRIDTVSGDVGLRKVFPTVFTANRDVYYGAHAIIRKKPTDPKVSALLFHSNDAFDKRIDAQNKIESYVVASYKENFWLFGNHVAGTKSVTFLQDLESTPPVVGEVYLLSDPAPYDQYIRIIDTTPQIVNLNWNNNGSIVTFTRRRVICEIEQALEFPFSGSAFDPVGQEEGKCETYATQVADAAKFYGTKSLSVDANIGATAIKIDTIYESLVPSSKAQSPLVNQTALSSDKAIIATGKTLTVTMSIPGGGWVGNVGSAVTPGSFQFGTTHSDDGKGNIVANSNPTVAKAGINYQTGEIDNSQAGLAVSGGVAVTFQTAIANPSDYNYTGSILINSGNQGLVFVKNLSPMPGSGKIYVDYRSQGKWYRIEGNQDGTTIGSDASIGAGNINNNGDGTGTLSLTLGSLPDIDSSLIITWGSAERLVNRKAEPKSLSLMFDLGVGNVDPTTLSIAAKNSTGTTHTITADSAGVLSDSAGVITGHIDKQTGKVYIYSTVNGQRFQNAASADNVTIGFNYADPGVGVAGEYKTAFLNGVAWTTVNHTTGTYITNVGETVSVGSVYVSIPFTWNTKLATDEYWKANRQEWVTLVADSSGNLRVQGNADTTVWGTIAANGDLTITPPTKTVKLPTAQVDPFSGVPRYNSALAKPQLIVTSNTSVNYYTTPPLSYPLVGSLVDKIENLSVYEIKADGHIGGEVAFRAVVNDNTASHNFFSKEGLIYNHVGSIVAQTQVGTIDRDTGVIQFQYLYDPDLFFVDLHTIGTDEKAEEDELQYIFDFRTSTTSLIPSSLQLRYNLSDAGSPLRNATTNQNGDITGTGINGTNSYVDAETGMVHIEFSTLAYPGSIKYDAVAEVTIPIDSELLGLNPIRLPSDGRVPIFQPGRHIVIFDEVTTPTTNPTPLANDSQILARSGQSYIEVIDVNGKRLDPNEYTTDRLTGTVVFSPTLALNDKYANPLTAPFSIVDRVEDMLLATDVQINGDMNLSAALTHNYTAANSKVASALVWGDTGSRVYNLFAQEIWNSGSPVWSDVLIGDPTTAQYDDINYPIQIDNQSSTPGRWAIIFTSSTTVQVAHEKLGIVAASISIVALDVAPLNPATGSPYFTINRNGFGGGWGANNVIRFNTDSGDRNMWVIRTVQSGALSELTDNIELEIRGDAN